MEPINCPLCWMRCHRLALASSTILTALEIRLPSIVQPSASFHNSVGSIAYLGLDDFPKLVCPPGDDNDAEERCGMRPTGHDGDVGM